MPGTARPPSGGRGHGAVAVGVVFGLNGTAVATWFARVPAARDALGLGAGRLGLVLLAMSFGAVLAMLTAGAVVHRLGTRLTVAGSTVLVAVGLAGTGVAISPWASASGSAAGLFVLGYGTGTCNVAMNVEAAVVERRLARAVMPRFHAVWSLGTVLAAGVAVLAARSGVPVPVHLGGIGLLVLVGTVAATRAFRSGMDGAARDTRAGGGSGVLVAWREPRTLLLGLLALAMAFAEGTANDWLAVAFVDGHHVAPEVGAAVFGVFVAAMTVGRTVGTVALDRWGRVPVVLGTMLLGLAGTLLTVFAGPAGAVTGVALWGLGVSLGFPTTLSAAADGDDLAAARVGVVAVLGYVAFLGGPPVLGLLGERAGILRALLVVPVLLVPALALLPALRPPRRDPTGPASGRPADGTRDGPPVAAR
ncbi:MFS transporter [Micromonospora sp. NPDC092111]|uniref:MFS transporter n=1 Tax=Micromonospora sp. NPDC092111 TaxID=3364289 RepID=UPI00382112F5